MIIHPDIFTHSKFIRLKSKVGDVALELLVRLWAHCQVKRRGRIWEGANSDYVEIICTGGAGNGRTFKALVDCGWIEDRGGSITVRTPRENRRSSLREPQKAHPNTPGVPPQQEPRQRPPAERAVELKPANP